MKKKNFVKLIGIISIVAAVALTFTGCNRPSDTNDTMPNLCDVCGKYPSVCPQPCGDCGYIDCTCGVGCGDCGICEECDPPTPPCDCGTCEECNPIVSLNSLFPDALLRNAVANVLGANSTLTGQALINALAEITILNANVAWTEPEGAARITNAAGIEYLTGLTFLSLDNNRLTSIDVSNNIALISLWLGANQLTSIDVSNNTALTHLQLGGNQLTNIDVSNNTALIELELQDNQLSSVNIGNSITSIGNHAFWRNQLSSVTIPNSVTSIGIHAFAGNQLTSVTIPNSVQTIESSAFAGNQLTSVVIPDSVTSIGWDAFWGNQLTSVTIGAGVTLGGTAICGHGFEVAYNNAGRPAGTWTRPNTGSSVWTMQP